MLENTEGAIKNGQSRETGNKGYTRRRQTKQKRTTVIVYQTMQMHTSLLQFEWIIYDEVIDSYLI